MMRLGGSMTNTAGFRFKYSAPHSMHSVHHTVLSIHALCFENIKNNTNFRMIAPQIKMAPKMLVVRCGAFGFPAKYTAFAPVCFATFAPTFSVRGEFHEAHSSIQFEKHFKFHEAHSSIPKKNRT